MRILAVSICTLLFALPGFSQANLGRILGVVTDQTGGVIAGATVSVIDVQRGITRSLVSDNDGSYSAPNLIPGEYTVRVEAKGFNAVERKGIVVEVGGDVRVDLSLKPGSQEQTVTVTGEVPAVNTTSATLGGTIQNQTINDLPVNGRNYQSLLDYRPGILSRPGGGTGSKVSNGMRDEYQVWMLDGLYDSNPYSGFGSIVGGPSQAGEAATILPIDAIQEIDLQENPKAELGWRPGAQVNVGLKSGTNDIHGTAYAYGRDTSLDARNPFFPETAPLAMEQFGATIGGAIKKDKLFYFGAYEGQRFTVGNPSTIAVPTTAAGPGAANSFPDAINDMLDNHGYVPPGSTLPGTHLSALSLNLAGCSVAGTAVPYSVSCNAANGIFGNSSTSTSEPVAYPNVGAPNDYLAKIDYHLNDHNSLNGEYYIGQNAELAVAAAVVQPYWRTQINTQAQAVRAVWTWTPNANWVNDARFGFDRITIPNISGDCFNNGQPNYTALGYVSGVSGEYSCGFPTVNIGSFLALGAGASRTNLAATPDGADSVSYTHGKHLFKFGAELRHTEWEGGTFTNSKGTLNFGTGNVNVFTSGTSTALENFLAGVPTNGSVIDSPGSPNRTLYRWENAVFAQDDWRVTRTITVNLGLRYEIVPAPSEKNNLLANFSPTQGMVQLGIQTNSIYRTDPNNFAPRLGVAWDVTGKGTTVVRAGAGITYVTEPFQNYVNTTGSSKAPTVGLQANPTGALIVAANGTTSPGPGTIQLGTFSLTAAQLDWAANQAVFAAAAGALQCGNGQAAVAPGTGTNPSPCALFAMAQNVNSAYVTQWNLGVQHAFNSKTSLDVSYVGNHGTELWGLYDANTPTPGLSGSAAEQLRRPFYSLFPYIANINEMANDDDSNYNALQTTLTERASHGLTFLAGYTYAHALDLSSSDIGQVPPMDSNDPQLDYGNSTFDVRHRFTLAGTYLIPGKKSRGQLLEGWQLNSAVNLMSGLPYSPLDSSTDLSGTGEYEDRWDLIGNASDFAAGGPSPIPCFGATGSSFAKAGCGALPSACTTAAAALGPATTKSLDTYGCYMEGNSVIIPPAQGTFGTMGRNLLRGRPFRQWDMSITKAWKINERLNTQFRIEAFNLLNAAEFAVPSSTGASLTSPGVFGESQGTPDVVNHNPMIGSGAAREMQIGLKLIF